jgi:hypothetical protein
MVLVSPDSIGSSLLEPHLLLGGLLSSFLELRILRMRETIYCLELTSTESTLIISHIGCDYPLETED